MSPDYDSAKLVGLHSHREQASMQPLPRASSAPTSRLLPSLLLMMTYDMEL